jgi:sirohydrochlorin cobaltochelatase
MKKQALLVISFGTSYHETYHKTIEKICQDLQAAFPDSDLFLAYTSKIIVKKLKKRDGIDIMTPAEAMDKIVAGGYDEVLCQTTHVINGHEFYGMIQELRAYVPKVPHIKIGRPLLSSHEDFKQVTDIVLGQVPPLSPVDAMVLMGHGTEHHANSAYPAMDHYLKQAGGPQIYMATVEGYPTLAEVRRHLKARHIRRVSLMPFMVVAGDHALNDMAGEEEDSWKNQLKGDGFDVHCIVKGMGELPAIRSLFVEHLQNGVDIKELL